MAGLLPDLVGWIALGTGALIASTVGGVAGFGAGIIMIPIVAFVMGAKATVPVMTVITQYLVGLRMRSHAPLR